MLPRCGRCSDECQGSAGSRLRKRSLPANPAKVPGSRVPKRRFGRPQVRRGSGRVYAVLGGSAWNPVPPCRLLFLPPAPPIGTNAYAHRGACRHTRVRSLVRRSRLTHVGRSRSDGCDQAPGIPLWRCGQVPVRHGIGNAWAQTEAVHVTALPTSAALGRDTGTS